MISGTAPSTLSFSVAIRPASISGIWARGSASSSIRFTKRMTSRDRMFEISRIRPMSVVFSAWWADRTTTQVRLSRSAFTVICSRIMNVSFTPGVSRIVIGTGMNGASSQRSAERVMSANCPCLS